MGARKRHATLASAGHSDDGADEFAVWHNLAGTASDRERILAAAVVEATGGRGVDVVFEAAWADESVSLAGEMVRLGGRLVLVGIPGDDRLVLTHSTFRRKGLTVLMSRRMKHTYPRAIRLAGSGALDLDDLVSHRFSLAEAPEAFALNARYRKGVHKIIVQGGG